MRQLNIPDSEIQFFANEIFHPCTRGEDGDLRDQWTAAVQAKCREIASGTMERTPDNEYWFEIYDRLTPEEKFHLRA